MEDEYNKPWGLGESTCMGEKEICMGKEMSFYMDSFRQPRSSRVLKIEGNHSGNV